MHLPQLVSKSVYPKEGLQFDFKADEGTNASQRVLTGHDNGLITINIAGGRRPRPRAGAARLRTRCTARCWATSATRWATATGTASSRGPRRWLISANYLGMSALTAARPCNGTTPRARRPTVAAALHQRLRQQPPLGGLGRNLGPLPAHSRHAANRPRLRPAPQSAPMPAATPGPPRRHCRAPINWR
ncbi:MAG: putative zinc-binding metallopeptidase [Hymenobacter sp.]